MKVVRIDDVAKEPIVSPLFTGRQVTRQALVTEAMSKYFSLGVVSFGQGIRNKFHTHSSDQVLIVTAGRGIVATEKEQRQVALGDVIHIPAGEKHWHGATGDAAFSHLALTAVGSKTTQLED
ncbi:MAG: cupin domain-containing protein [Chloroflexi bacterium]|nr:cupin domain-containing protein [Chloroflexota bacterium]